MIKSTQHVSFDSHYANFGYSMDYLEFSDKDGNKVVVNYKPTDMADLGYRLLNKSLRIWNEKGVSVFDRDEMVSLLQDATQYLEATKPVDA